MYLLKHCEYNLKKDEINSPHILSNNTDNDETHNILKQSSKEWMKTPASENAYKKNYRIVNFK